MAGFFPFHLLYFFPLLPPYQQRQMLSTNEKASVLSKKMAYLGTFTFSL